MWRRESCNVYPLNTKMFCSVSWLNVFIWESNRAFSLISLIRLQSADQLRWVDSIRSSGLPALMLSQGEADDLVTFLFKSLFWAFSFSCLSWDSWGRTRRVGNEVSGMTIQFGGLLSYWVSQRSWGKWWYSQAVSRECAEGRKKKERA